MGSLCKRELSIRHGRYPKFSQYTYHESNYHNNQHYHDTIYLILTVVKL